MNVPLCFFCRQLFQPYQKVCIAHDGSDTFAESLWQPDRVETPLSGMHYHLPAVQDDKGQYHVHYHIQDTTGYVSMPVFLCMLGHSLAMRRKIWLM